MNAACTAPQPYAYWVWFMAWHNQSLGAARPASSLEPAPGANRPPGTPSCDRGGTPPLVAFILPAHPKQVRKSAVRMQNCTIRVGEGLDRGTKGVVGWGWADRTGSEPGSSRL